MIDTRTVFISDHIYKHNQSYLFWILGLFYGSVSFSLNGADRRFRLFAYLCDFSVYIQKTRVLGQSKLSSHIKVEALKGLKSRTFETVEVVQSSFSSAPISENPMFPFRIYINPLPLKRPKAFGYPKRRSADFGAKPPQIGILELSTQGFLRSKISRRESSTKLVVSNALSSNNKSQARFATSQDVRFVQVIPAKLINLFYNINPSFLNYFYHIDYPNLFHTYWLTGFLETNLTYLSISFNNLTLPLHEPAKLSCGKGSETLHQVKDGRLSFLNSHPKLTYIKFELNVHSNNLYNLLLLNKLFKGKILLINHTYKLILKFNFGEKEIKQIIGYLDNYPFLSSRYSTYLKLRQIYRICQRKENYYHKGILQILRAHSARN